MQSIGRSTIAAGEDDAQPGPDEHSRDHPRRVARTAAPQMNHMVITALCLAFTALAMTATSANAELLRVELRSRGMESNADTRAVTAAMQKVEGVQSVAVNLKDGVTILELREGNTVTLAQLRTLIKNSGLVPLDANVVARGSLVGDLFEVRFSGERLRVKGQLAKLAIDRWTLVVPAPK